MADQVRPGSRSPGTRNIAIAVLVALLAGIVLYAALREVRSTPAPSPVASGAREMGHVERPAFTANEERFANDLWKVHDRVRTNAVRMSFVGLSYKLGDLRPADLPTRLEPIVQDFRVAVTDATALVPPESLQGLHQEYLAALRGYEQAATAMARAGKDHDTDQRLIEAQQRSEQSSTTLLKVGEALWPGEHKPN